MKSITEKYIELKRGLGGNREKYHYEDTFGMPKEEQAHITMPCREHIRIISELEFAINMSNAMDNRFSTDLTRTLDFLLEQKNKNGTLTVDDCGKAEQMLKALESPAKEYKLILVGHAHIDMNWMWAFHETVAAILATFRSVLNIMDQYPEFHFSQSQASVYKIVEEYDPILMERIKQRISEGRWEVTASSWVETDKNMPNTESLLRHIEYTRDYLSKSWGAKDFELDFSPDTFGHNANIPEIDTFGGVKYFYHCRGMAEDYVLYRYKSPSGKELLCYKEPNWYNGAITPHIGDGLIELTRRCAGLKTGLVVYGVGDHGGGPTRRDVERALDMMNWKIYPEIKFGTLKEFFHEAETVREKLPIVNHELNYFAPGCYTTQSRIKRGNRRIEVALYDSESLSVLAEKYTDFKFDHNRLKKAWQDVLFTQFHDILTGSCVQDSREYAMGLFQKSMATSNTQINNAMNKIAESIDTSSILVDVDAYNSQSEGAGSGYGVENYSGVPSPERGTGKKRIFHLFNTLLKDRKEVVELTVWDWVGDLRCIKVTDSKGKELDYQLVDQELLQYWDHKYFRILVDAFVPSMGYATIVLDEGVMESYPCYFQENERVSKFYNDYVLENDKIRVVIASDSGRICSLQNLIEKKEIIKFGQTAGFEFLETEVKTSSAWQIGRTIRKSDIDRCTQLELVQDGKLRKSVRAMYRIEDSELTVIYSLDKHAEGVRIDAKTDWKQTGGETIPVLTYEVPVSYYADRFLYDIPAGAIQRKALNNDVPGLQYGMPINEEGLSAIVISDSKYGYRGSERGMTLTLINSATSPDPYPERGIHNISILLGTSDSNPKTVEEMATGFNHKLLYLSSNSHKGTLPLSMSLIHAESEGIILSAITKAENGTLIVRGYEVSGTTSCLLLAFADKVKCAQAVNLLGQKKNINVRVEDVNVQCSVEPYSLFELEITL